MAELQREREREFDRVRYRASIVSNPRDGRGKDNIKNGLNTVFALILISAARQTASPT